MKPLLQEHYDQVEQLIIEADKHISNLKLSHKWLEEKIEQGAHDLDALSSRIDDARTLRSQVAMEKSKALWSRNHALMFDEILPQLHRRAFILHAFMVVEKALFKICVKIKTQRKLPVGHRDMKGRGIQQCQTYLRLVEVSLGDAKHWTNIIDLQKLRNCIAHVYGNIRDCKEDDRKFLQDLTKKKGLALQIDGEDEFIIIKPEFCQVTLDNCRAFLEEILDALFPDRSSLMD